MKLRKWLILSHRYLGMAFSALIVMWFATGIAMMYVGGMPRLTPEQRLDRLTPIDVSQVRLTPAQAAEAGYVRPPSRALLMSVGGRPAYRFGGNGGTTIVYADNGDVADEFTTDQTRAMAARFMRVPLDQVTFLDELQDADQWTLGLGRAFPLHKFAIGDDQGSQLYISPVTGDAVMLTTSKTRTFAWISTIPHWLYFAFLRDNQPVWYEALVWTSGITVVVAILGLALGVTQYRRGRATLAASIPYAGLMRWHYITGVVFGVFTVTWAFSGLVSMEPWAWTNQRGMEVRGDALTGGRIQLADYQPMDPLAWSRLLDGAALKEVEFVRLQGEPYYIVRRTVREGLDLGKRERLHAPYPINGRVAPDRLIVSAKTLEPRTQPFSEASIVARVREGVTAPIAEHELLTEYDSYYYSRNHQTPLPVVRLKLEDAAHTWVYVDPQTNQVLANISKGSRMERWFYNALHSLDVGYLYSRPLWDIVMLVLLLGGLTSSAIGFYLGWKRLGRALAKTVPRPAAAPGDMGLPAR